MLETSRRFRRAVRISTGSGLSARGWLRSPHENIFIGTSSWKYEGWLDQIYSRERYMTRGRFSQKRFNAECLANTPKHFPSFAAISRSINFRRESYWRKLFGSAPATLQFAFKAPGRRHGEAVPAPSALRPARGRRQLLVPGRRAVSKRVSGFAGALSAARRRADFRVRQLRPAVLSGRRRVSRRNWIRFWPRCPRDFRYAVEIRNPEFLAPEYFACLRSHGVAHVFNAWTRMPEIGIQMHLRDAYTADFTVARALLRQGRPYEEAVAKFTPYARVQDPNPETRDALRLLIAQARKRHEPSYIFVNNRLEGNAPETIEAIMD